MLIDSARSSSDLLHALKGCYDIRQWQCLSVIVVHHPISVSGAEKVPKTWHFVFNLRVDIGRKDGIVFRT